MDKTHGQTMTCLLKLFTWVIMITGAISVIGLVILSAMLNIGLLMFSIPIAIAFMILFVGCIEEKLWELIF